MFKNLTNLASMMKQAQQMGERMKSVGEELKTQRVTAVAGGGLVEVEMNGASEMLRVKIDSSLLAESEQEMLEELLVAATNQAQQKARELHAQAMQEMTMGMDIPGMDDALSNLTGGQ